MKFDQDPSFSRSMILFAFFMVIAGVSLTFIGQPVEYWLDFSRATSDLPWVHAALTVHPFLFAAATIIYLTCLGVLFKRLPRLPAIVLWITVCFIHLRYVSFGLGYDIQSFFQIDENVASSISMGFFILFSVVLGIFLAHLLPVKQFTASEIQIRPARSSQTVLWTAVSISAIWLVILVLGLMNVQSVSDVGWHSISPDHLPGQIAFAEVAYDINRQKAVLFGGQIWVQEINGWTYSNDTWEWDGQDWFQSSPTHSPSAREKHAMAYDPERGVVVLFGGFDKTGYLADVWEWNGEDWEQKTPSFPPSARSWHSMFYDTQRGKVVLYGGQGQDDTFFQDAWEWDGLEWTPIIFEGIRPYAIGHDLAYFEAAHYSVLIPNWVWQEDGWVVQQFEAFPETRELEGLAYDPVHERMVLFGGVHNGEFLDDTWLFTQEGWQQLDLPYSPPGRKTPVVFFDPVRERIMLLGGTNENVLDDMWELWLPDTE